MSNNRESFSLSNTTHRSFKSQCWGPASAMIPMQIRPGSNFYLNADPDQGSQSNADPDPGQTLLSQNNQFLLVKYHRS